MQKERFHFPIKWEGIPVMGEETSDALGGGGGSL